MLVVLTPLTDGFNVGELGAGPVFDGKGACVASLISALSSDDVALSFAGRADVSGPDVVVPAAGSASEEWDIALFEVAAPGEAEVDVDVWPVVGLEVFDVDEPASSAGAEDDGAGSSAISVDVGAGVDVAGPDVAPASCFGRSGRIRKRSSSASWPSNKG